MQELPTLLIGVDYLNVSRGGPQDPGIPRLSSTARVEDGPIEHDGTVENLGDHGVNRATISIDGGNLFGHLRSFCM